MSQAFATEFEERGSDTVSSENKLGKGGQSEKRGKEGEGLMEMAMVELDTRSSLCLRRSDRFH